MSAIVGLRCTVCHSSRLASDTKGVSCDTCGRKYPIIDGVLVMFESVSVQSGDVINETLASQVLLTFGLSNDPISLLRIRTMIRRKVNFGSSLIRVESQQFLDRALGTGHKICAPVQTAIETAPRDLVTLPRYHWTKNYVPCRMAAGVEILANMRLENRGAIPLYKSGSGRVLIALRWGSVNGVWMDAPDERTPLSIDLLPGKAVTIATRVLPPQQPGDYLLSITLVQEQVRWLDEDSLTMAVRVVEEVPAPVPDGWLLLPEEPKSYDADHRRGRLMLSEWLHRYAPLQPRVLEIGGNTLPMAAYVDADLGVDLVNVDVDLLGLQVGQMVARQRGIQLQQVCADAFDLPFSPGYFDAIVIFASLHHFPDPAALLERLRLKLKPEGFIGLFCEPVGHTWPGAIIPAFLADLEKGINEQSFSLREYELMFYQADLMATEVVVDNNSLKARLVHAPNGEWR